MALTDIPSIKDIKIRIISDVEAKINQDIPADDEIHFPEDTVSYKIMVSKGHIFFERIL